VGGYGHTRWRCDCCCLAAHRILMPSMMLMPIILVELVVLSLSTDVDWNCFDWWCRDSRATSVVYPTPCSYRRCVRRVR
jgi:hypothetical protein